MAKATRKTSTTKKTTIATDPIFAAIECHRKLDRAWLNLEAASDEEYAKICASEAAEKAAWKMARTEPSTAAGA